MTPEEYFRQRWGGKSYGEAIADGTLPNDLAMYRIMQEYAKECTLSIAREAVQEVNEMNRSAGLSENILEFTRGSSAYILSRIKSKL